jgi:hypothetical protein
MKAIKTDAALICSLLLWWWDSYAKLAYGELCVTVKMM